jgi:hypothetical protein
MKRTNLTALLGTGFLIFGLVFLNFPASGQDTLKFKSTLLPEDVNKIVFVSCTPCHTSEGGLMSRSKLNFTEWDRYSPEKQKEKAVKMYSEISKGGMPPKKAREMSPEKIPAAGQAEIIRKWSESFPPDKN